MWKSFARKVGEGRSFGAAEVEEIAHELAEADVVAFSSMTGYADLTKELATRVRELNPKAYTMWGGIHPIIYPEDAVKADVDAICTGEGELAFAEWLHHFEKRQRLFEDQQLLVQRPRASGDIKRNPFRPLMSSAELASMPFPKYGGAEGIYEPAKGFRPVTARRLPQQQWPRLSRGLVDRLPAALHLLRQHGLHRNERNYRKIRHSGVDYIIGEVQAALKVHPYLKTVLFYDDSFMAIFAARADRVLHALARGSGHRVLHLRRHPDVRAARQSGDPDVGGHEPRADGNPERSERILKFYKRRRRSRANRAVPSAALAEFRRLPDQSVVRHHRRQPGRNAPGRHRHARCARPASDVCRT